ncbi:MAG: hypothetical protein ACE5NW_18870, partial [Acidiferrobacterales bacterium]
ASQTSSYSFGEFVYLTSGRDTRVVVRGNPFNMDRKAFEKAVTDAMQGQHWGPRTHFTTGPSETARKDIRVVMLFNGPKTVLTGDLCKAPEKFGSVKGGDGLRVRAAYCNKDVPLTEVNAWTDPVAGTKAPNFARLVIRTTRELFPLPFRSYNFGHDVLRD